MRTAVLARGMPTLPGGEAMGEDMGIESGLPLLAAGLRERSYRGE